MRLFAYCDNRKALAGFSLVFPKQLILGMTLRTTEKSKRRMSQRAEATIVLPSIAATFLSGISVAIRLKGSCVA
jgi:hypothetical protein